MQGRQLSNHNSSSVRPRAVQLSPSRAEGSFQGCRLRRRQPPKETAAVDAGFAPALPPRQTRLVNNYKCHGYAIGLFRAVERLLMAQRLPSSFCWAFLHRGSLSPRAKANVDRSILFKLHFRTARDYVPASQKAKSPKNRDRATRRPTLLESSKIGFLAIPQLSAYPTALPAPPAARPRQLL
jgi:hypothetical protein